MEGYEGGELQLQATAGELLPRQLLGPRAAEVDDRTRDTYNFVTIEVSGNEAVGLMHAHPHYHFSLPTGGIRCNKTLDLPCLTPRVALPFLVRPGPHQRALCTSLSPQCALWASPTSYR